MMNREAWAKTLDSHLYEGKCPDLVEGYETRDVLCFACHALDHVLGVETPEWAFDLSESSTYEIRRTYKPIYAHFTATHDDFSFSAALSFMEALSWVQNDQDWIQVTLAEFLETVKMLTVPEEYAERLNTLPTLFLLAGPIDQ